MKRSKIILMSILTIFLFIGILNVNAITTGDTSGNTDTNSKIVTDTANLTVTGVEVNDTFRAYKILDTFYNSSTNVITYEFTSDFNNFKNSSYGTSYQNLTVDEYTDLSTSDVDKLSSAYAGYIKGNNISGTDMSVSGTVASATLQAGSYLVLPTSTVKIYSVMVGNLDFTASGNDWIINNEEIVAKVSEAGVSKAVGEVGYTSGSYSIGDNITFIITGTVPTYPTNATNRVYTIKDTLSTGLTFNDISNIKIEDGGELLTTASNGTVTNTNSETVATIDITEQVMTIEFNAVNINSNTITITYTASLNDEAGLGVDGGNENNAELTYSNDPYGEGTYTTTGIVTNVYTYGLEIYKYVEDNNTNALEGAEFTIYKDSSLEDAITTITTNNNGIATYAGLASGTYYVRETKAPTGYRLDSTVREIKIGPGEDSLNESETNRGYYRLEVSNQELGLLPVTGSTGTIIITLVGLTIVVCASILFITSRKKRARRGKKINL